jgi:acetyl-CoA carboxylase biotin carboxylase subunit
VDSHCYEGNFVPPYYDSLIAKVIATGEDRNKAIEKMQSALQNFVISGIPTTIPFIKLLISDPDFINMNTNTRWLEDNAEKFYISNS